MRVVRLSQPSVEPVLLDEAKAHLRVSHDEEDALIETYVAAARERVETYCNRPFVSASFAALYDGALPLTEAPIALPLPDITAIDSVEYRDADGDIQTMAAEDYTLDAARRELRPVEGWPTGTDLRVEFTAGDDSTAPEIPRAVRAAILLYAADLFEARQTQVIGETVSQNRVAEMLLDPFRERMGI